MQANKGTNIPENVLKNFNPYEILQPQKVKDTKFDLLVDISDDSNEYDKRNSIQTDLDTTLPKINPDLIDLFENVLITPQQIDKRNRKLDHIEEWPFLNVLSKPGCSNEVIKKDDCENCTKENTPKILSPPSMDNINLDSNKNTQNNPLNTQLYECKDDNTDSLYSSCKYDLEDHDELLDEILQSKSFEMTYRNNSDIPVKNTNNSIAHAMDLKQNNITSEDMSLKLLETASKDQINDKVHKAKDVKQNVTSEKITLKLIETVTKDEKVFLKRLIKCADKSNYTRGPSIYEKSLLLPQIMERLTARKTVLEARKNLQRRLILDCGSECPVSMPELNPTVLMEDCKSYRLLGFKTREGFQHFIRTGRF